MIEKKVGLIKNDILYFNIISYNILKFHCSTIYVSYLIWYWKELGNISLRSLEKRMSVPDCPNICQRSWDDIYGCVRVVCTYPVPRRLPACHIRGTRSLRTTALTIDIWLEYTRGMNTIYIINKKNIYIYFRRPYYINCDTFVL